MRKSRVGGFAIELRVERRIVVHFELKIYGERSAAGEDIGEQVGETATEIGALNPDARQLFGALFPMLGRRVCAHGFLLHVKFFEREDRKTVDHHSRRLRISRATAGGWLEFRDDGLVHFFDEVIAFLIIAIDRALRPVHAFEPKIVAPRDVFFVPELEIAEVVFLDELDEARAAGNRGNAVPALDERELMMGDVSGVENHGVGERIAVDSAGVTRENVRLDQSGL